MSRPLSTRFPLFRSIALCTLFAGFLAACSGGSSGQQSAGSGDQSAGTGGVAFRLLWHQPVTGARALTPAFNACVDHGIETISATVSDATATVTTVTWPCSAHEGRIVGIPDGQNYTVRVDGIASVPSTTTLWSGLTSTINVNAGQITDVGTIVMNYIGGDATQPAVTSIVPHSNPTITANVPVTDRVVIAFTESMALSTITTTNIRLTLSDTTPVPGIVSYASASAAAVFTPSSVLAYDTQYVLHVISCVTLTSCITDHAGNQLASDYTSTFTTESAPLTAPGAPLQVTASPGNSQITLDWLASNGTVSYNLYFGLTSGVTMTNGTLLAGVRAPYVHRDLVNNQTYYYLVTALNGTGETPAAVEASATPVFPTAAPSLPSSPVSLAVAPVSGQNTVTWSAVAGATSYNLYWSMNPITPDKYAADNVVRGVSSPYLHTGLTDGMTYYYIVTSMNSYRESADSMQVSGGVGAIQIVW